ICNHCFSIVFFFSSRRRHTRSKRDWSSDVCSSDLQVPGGYRIFTNLISYGQDDDQTDPEVDTVNEILELVDQFAEEGAIKDEEVVRSLQLHLMASSHYENQEEGEKLIKHMNG